jgi:NADPH2:quinone reductase
MRAIQFSNPGGVEVLETRELPVPVPGQGEVLVRNSYVGVNFVDTYYRRGIYQAPLPLTSGMEGGGEVTAVGPGVDRVKPGDSVTYAMQLGAYAEQTLVPVGKTLPVPSGLDIRLATAATLQGLTAWFLVHTTYPIQEGDDILIHAGSGGVGQLLVQLAKLRGARVFTTVSTPEKAVIARDRGADHVLDYQDFDQAVREHTGGKGVHAVFDSVGKTTFLKSLDSLRRRGMCVLFGQSSGPAPLLDPQVLRPKGSLFLTRPTLSHHMEPREELLRMSEGLFKLIADGRLKINIDQIFPFDQAAKAHQYIEARKTKGKVLLEL